MDLLWVTKVYTLQEQYGIKTLYTLKEQYGIKTGSLVCV